MIEVLQFNALICVEFIFVTIFSFYGMFLITFSFIIDVNVWLIFYYFYVYNDSFCLILCWDDTSTYVQIEIYESIISIFHL